MEQENILFEFNYNKQKKSINFNFKICNNACDAYIISKNDYNLAIKFLENRKEQFKNKKIEFFTKFKGVEKESKKNNEFIIVNEGFLKSIEIDNSDYKDRNIIYFQIESIHYIYFYDDNTVLEISRKEYSKENEQISDDEEFQNQEEEKDDILTSLILLYANEKNFWEKIKSSIKDEYDINEYYLINKKWVKDYKNKFKYNEIYKTLEKENFDYSYKGYLHNLENIKKLQTISKFKEKIRLKNSNLLDENEFFPIIKEKFKGIKEIKDNICPKEFILVPENLFDLFHKKIKRNDNKYSKKDYKFNILMGDNFLFIQDKKKLSTFYVMDEKLELYFIFSYNDNITFFKEVKKYIKGEGLFNYIIKRNLVYKENDSFIKILNSKNCEIGEYIAYKSLDEKFINKYKNKKILSRNKYLYDFNREFMEDICDLKENNIKTSNINDLFKKLKNIDKIELGIVLNEDLIEIKKILFFEQIKELNKIKDKNEYNKKEEDIINKISKNKKDIISFIENMNIYIPNEIDDDKKNENNYNFINMELLKEINNSKEFFEGLEKIETCYYCKNNNEYLILYPKSKKIYRIECSRENDSIKLKEYYSSYNSQNEEDILENSNDLYENEQEIKKLLESPLEKISFPKEYYIVDENWIKEYKDSFNINQKSSIKRKISFFKNSENLYPEIINIKKSNIYKIPIKFEIINVQILDSILEIMNKNYNLKINTNYKYEISFGANKIFIKDESNKTSFYYIYSFINGKIELEYILININKSIKKFFSSYSKNNEIFEEFLSRYKIDFSLTDEEQPIQDENLDIIGYLININAKSNSHIRNNEPKHCLGLENIGATCYMNATIQCLCHVLNVKNYFQNTELVNKDTKDKNCPLTKEFYKLVNNLWKEPTRNKKYYTPTDFKDCISILNPLFKGIAANDSKDLIIFIYETIHNEINKKIYYQINNNINNYDLILFRNNYYSNNSSFLIDTFYFEQQSELTCLNCNYNKISYNISNIIIFPLEKVREYMIKKSPNGFLSVTLKDCFENFQDKEILQGINRIFCNQCHQMSDASSANKIHTCPEVMTIILNRGKGLEFDVNFEYPLIFDISKFIVDKTSTNNYQYELICVLTHLGPSGMAGHFIAFCKSPVDGNWYCYNDSEVSECIDPRQYKTGQIEEIPYVLFYQKLNKKDKNKYDFTDLTENKNINNENQNNIITIYFNFNDKQFYLEVENTIKIKDLINKLQKYYSIPKSSRLFLLRNNNFDELQQSKTVSDYNIENGTILTIV